ncbi:hypothetical protein [Halorarum halobium]|uniref:hypothetical protein n=1 Tax=Halorarum halobium TaxID=3075121 RepID=UPI0028A95399|nr:hypothetical protein [Halobaculum sp. XH14]
MVVDARRASDGQVPDTPTGVTSSEAGRARAGVRADGPRWRKARDGETTDGDERRSDEETDGDLRREAGETYGGADAPEVARLRRENARLRRQLVARDRERQHIITRYEALLADAHEGDRTDAEGENDTAGASSPSGNRSWIGKLRDWLR